MATDTLPLPEQVENIENQMLVQIVIKGTTIHVYPMRASDAVVYKRGPRSPKVPSPAKPTQVRWVVKGLKKNQFLRIKQKSGQDKQFPFKTYKIPFPDNSILSGKPLHRAGGPGKELSWNYSITLVEDGIVQPGALDPTIIIKDNP